MDMVWVQCYSRRYDKHVVKPIELSCMTQTSDQWPSWLSFVSRDIIHMPVFYIAK